MRKQLADSPQKEEQPEKILNPSQVMGLKNNKSYSFRKEEIYPTILPPISKCNPTSNANADFDPKLKVKEYTRKLTPTEFRIQWDLMKDKKVRNNGKIFQLGQHDWARLTPYDIIRMRNCKTFNVQKAETYPSIRPPVSKCSTVATAEWLADAAEYNCGSRLFDMEKDDILEVWKTSPKKQTLSYYGVGSGIYQPEAYEFNQAILKCLNKINASRPNKNVKVPQIKYKARQAESCGGLVLNRQLLESKITRMPLVKRNLQGFEALAPIHCPRAVKQKEPFQELQPMVSLKVGLGMEKPVPERKYDSKRKHNKIYCGWQRRIPENMCTYYEWRKYKQEPKSYEEAFQKEMDQEQRNQVIESEPKNYEELYTEFITCFENDLGPDPMGDVYDKYCRRKPKHDPEQDVGGRRGDPQQKTKPGIKPPVLMAITSVTSIYLDKPKQENERKTDEDLLVKEDTSKEPNEPKKLDKPKQEIPVSGKKTNDELPATEEKHKKPSKPKKPKEHSSKADISEQPKDKPQNQPRLVDKSEKHVDQPPKLAKIENQVDQPSKLAKPEKQVDQPRKSVTIEDYVDQPTKLTKPEKHVDHPPKLVKLEKQDDQQPKLAKPDKHVDQPRKLVKPENQVDQPPKLVKPENQVDQPPKLGKPDNQDDQFPKLVKPKVQDDQPPKLFKPERWVNRPPKLFNPIKHVDRPPKLDKPVETPNEIGDIQPLQIFPMETVPIIIIPEPTHPSKFQYEPPKQLEPKLLIKRPSKPYHRHRKYGKKPDPPPAVVPIKKDCPCKICKLLKRESDSPCIRKMKQEAKKRELLEYYRMMCKRENLNCSKQEYRAPQHKCDAIICDSCFCHNTKLGEYCDCLGVMQDLQKSLDTEQHRTVGSDLEDLKRRICKRFCDCL